MPAATTIPRLMMATWLQKRCTVAMTWLEMMTVPPASAKSRRVPWIVWAETGSTASKGSSRTRTLGEWTRAQARWTFLRMPAE